MDELSDQLGSARVECTLGNVVVNHLIFAIDICVFSPSTCGLQCLLNICDDFAAEHEIIFNCNKTIVFFLAQNSINNLLHQMLFKMVYAGFFIRKVLGTRFGPVQTRVL